MATQYDPNILQQYADDLYRQAKSIIFITGLRYGAFVFVIALAALYAVDSRARADIFASSNMFPVWAVAAIAFLIGLDSGARKAFRLKLEAQRILCDRQIELNTRAQETSVSAAKA